MEYIWQSSCLSLLNVNIKTRLFTDLRPLLESIGSSGQIEEKALRQSVAYLKQSLEDEDMMDYSWIPGEEIVGDILTKQGLRHEALNEILVRNVLRHAQTEDNLVMYEEDECKIRNLVAKKDKEAKKVD